MNDLTRSLAGDLLLFLAILTAAVWAGVAATTLRRRGRARRVAITRHPSSQPRRCDLTDCRQVATAVFDLPGLPGSTFGACSGHTAKVAEWVGQPAYGRQQGGAA